MLWWVDCIQRTTYEIFSLRYGNGIDCWRIALSCIPKENEALGTKASWNARVFHTKNRLYSYDDRFSHGLFWNHVACFLLTIITIVCLKTSLLNNRKNNVMHHGCCVWTKPPAVCSTHLFNIFYPCFYRQMFLLSTTPWLFRQGFSGKKKPAGK